VPCTTDLHCTEGPGRTGTAGPLRASGSIRQTAPMTVRVSRRQVLAWRLAAHSLGERLPAARRVRPIVRTKLPPAGVVPGDGMP